MIQSPFIIEESLEQQTATVADQGARIIEDASSERISIDIPRIEVAQPSRRVHETIAGRPYSLASASLDGPVISLGNWVAAIALKSIRTALISIGVLVTTPAVTCPANYAWQVAYPAPVIQLEKPKDSESPGTHHHKSRRIREPEHHCDDGKYKVCTSHRDRSLPDYKIVVCRCEYPEWRN